MVRFAFVRWILLLGLFGSFAPGVSRANDPAVFLEGVDLGSGLGTLLRDEALGAHRDLRRFFGASVPGPITVAWVADRTEFARQSGHPAGTVAGVAIAARGRIVLDGTTLSSNPERIPGVVHHEVCHLVFAAATDGAEVEPPRWLNEGIAMWRSGEWDLGLAYQRDPGALLHDALSAGSLPSFRQLDASFPRGTFFRVAYAQSVSFVNWLVKRGGERGIQQFVDRLDRDEDPEPAFEAVYGLSLQAAEDEWRAGLGAGSAWGRIPSADAIVGGLFWVLGGLMIVRFAWIRWRLHRDRLEEDEEDEEEEEDEDGAEEGTS